MVAEIGEWIVIKCLRKIALKSILSMWKSPSNFDWKARSSNCESFDEADCKTKGGHPQFNRWQLSPSCYYSWRIRV